MRRGGAAVLAGITFVLVALLSGALTNAYLLDVEAHTTAVDLATSKHHADNPHLTEADRHGTADRISGELVHLFDVERGAALEVWKLTRHSRAFGYTLAGKIALMVALGLFWIAARVRGRSIRVLNGVRRPRIQAEDLVGFATAVIAASIGVGIGASFMVGIRSDAHVLSYFVRTYGVVASVVVVASLGIIGLISMFTLPSHHLLAQRTMSMRGLMRAVRAARLIAFGLVILAMGPTIRAATSTGAPNAPSVGTDTFMALAEGDQVAARYARYELWIATAAVGSLVFALILSSMVGAYLGAVANSRRDFATRINGAEWWRVGLGSSRYDVLMMALVATALVALIPSHLTLAHVSGAVVLLFTAVAGGLAAQIAARHQVFSRMTRRSA